jgi:hypothetical protein
MLRHSAGYQHVRHLKKANPQQPKVNFLLPFNRPGVIFCQAGRTLTKQRIPRLVANEKTREPSSSAMDEDSPKRRKSNPPHPLP